MEWCSGRRRRLFLQGREGLQGCCQLAPHEGHGLGSVQPSLLGDLYLVQFLDADVRYCCAADCGHQVRLQEIIKSAEGRHLGLRVAAGT